MSINQIKQPEKYLVSACLVGLCTRYDARIKPSSACMKQLQGAIWIPVCPEQLGGLSTPRTPAGIVGGNGSDVLTGRARVITRSKQDVTAQFISGARQCLTIALAQDIQNACLKTGSPSCGLNPQTGVTATLLQQHGIRIIEFE